MYCLRFGLCILWFATQLVLLPKLGAKHLRHTWYWRGHYVDGLGTLLFERTWNSPVCQFGQNEDKTILLLQPQSYFKTLRENVLGALWFPLRRQVLRIFLRQESRCGISPNYNAFAQNPKRSGPQQLFSLLTSPLQKLW